MCKQTAAHTQPDHRYKTHNSNWTQVLKRRPRLPHCGKLRFPTHLHDSLKTPSGTDSEDSEGSTTEPSKVVGGSPIPVAASTRSRAKLKSLL